MRKGFAFLVTLITGMIIGTMIGMVVINTLISYRIDQYHERISYLENTIAEKDMRLKKLEESINKKKFILKNVEVILIHNGDQIDRMKLEKYIRELYSKLLGKEVKTIDTDMVVEVVNKRTMVIEESKYKLKFNRLILTETLKIWIEVEEELL